MPEDTRKISARDLALEIDDGRNSITVDQGMSFGRTVAAVLEDKGWRPFETGSYCSKATFETHLKKGNRRVEIISAVFMGAFTQVRCWTVD